MKTKRLLQSGGLVLAGAAIVFGGKFIFKGDKSKQIKELEQEIVALKTELGQINDEKPNNIISLDDAKVLFHNYDSTRVKWTNEEIKNRGKENFEATTSLFYNLDNLNNYLAYIKRVSKEAGVTPSGLRFYFGSYGKDYMRKGSNEYAYRQTIFIAPTETIQSGEKTEHLGYTFDEDNKKVFLRDKIATKESPEQSGSGASMQKAGIFSISTNLLFNGNSTIANELNGSPPRGEDEQ